MIEVLYFTSMANTILRLDHEKKALLVVWALCLSLLMHGTDARDFKVGGSSTWAVPTDPNAETYNQWAERNRFQTGDSLLFVYTPETDSVLLVSQEDYKNCNTASPIATFNDGKTTFMFNSSGAYHFISGTRENCEKNEKLVVIVMADRSAKAPTASPPTSTSPEVSPPPPSAASPPAPESSSGPTASTPSSAPVGTESPPTNGAYTGVVNFMASFGALLGCSLLFAV